MLPLLALLLASCKRVVVQYPTIKVMAEKSIDISSEIDDLLWLSFVIAIGIVVVCFVLAKFVYGLENNRWNRFWDWLEGHLTWMFGLTWLFGFCVYAVGMFVGIEETSETSDRFLHLLGVAPMAAIHAFGMFILESDVSTVHQEFHENITYMVLFSFAHFFAAFVSLIFVIKHFGYNIVAGIKLWLTSHGFRRYDQLFIFWGMNDATCSALPKILRSQGRSEDRGGL